MDASLFTVVGGCIDAGCVQAGLLPLEAVDAASATSIDSHLSNSLLLGQDSIGSFIGWSNGDVVGIRRECNYTACNDSSLVTQFTRSAANTASELIFYNTQVVASVRTRDTSSARSNEGLYSATNLKCYSLALEAGRESSTRYLLSAAAWWW